MKALFVGWDVGAWNCDKRKSQDAICALTGGSLDDLGVAAAPNRMNLRSAIVDGSCPDSLIEPLGLAETFDRVVVGIDAALGWPDAFCRLIAHKGGLEAVPLKCGSNPYYFRKQDRDLYDRGFHLLSPVRDMIGGQASKGMYFLAKGEFNSTNMGVWTSNGWTALETYPTPTKGSRVLQRHFQRLQPHLGPLRENEDIRDALRCALVAALFALTPDDLAAPDSKEASSENEGWIWIPKDCEPPRTAARGPRA